ncbi:hypothetical protein D9613_003953 [Agrocybe pediades]|uniref:NAD(P)-binding protein n=1 Tax=Agrocybe pediades TaxID=84607 RepID=A0A8H4QKF8_9AGAR|nr:hypothetical protein D9613_003953 [Agrocybe pediades]
MSLRTAIVTGAAQGIGRAIASRLARDGYHVVLNDLPSRKREVEGLRSEIINGSRIQREQSGKTATASVCVADVSIEQDVSQMVEHAVRETGGLDVMVSNAVCFLPKTFLETTSEDLHKTFGVNVEGTFFCYKHAALQMIKQGRGGRIIGASSLAGKQGTSILSAYSASKFAVRGLTQSAALELAPHNITVNAYAPGFTDTPSLYTLFNALKERNIPGRADPSKRLIMPEEIAGLVSYLVSDEAAMITGQSISINGGLFFD